jgi:hypothetical protein
MTTATGHTSAIRAKKVIGSNVTDLAGKEFAHVEHVVLDKQSSSVMFAVVGWSSLDYDDSRDAYVVEYTKDQLKAAPGGSIEELTRNDGAGYRDRVLGSAAWIAQQLHQSLRLDRLCEVMIEAGRARAGLVTVLTPAGDRDQAQRRCR